jgi:outer membrane murein-binding lipoprotein Lpp
VAKKHDIFLLGVCILLAGVIVCGIVLTGGYAKGIIDAQSTIDKLSKQNRQLEKTIADFANERQRIYKEFADTIGGASGDISNAIATTDRLFELSKKVTN